MRLTLIVAIAALLAPVALNAHPASAPGLSAGTEVATDVSAAKKKAKAKSNKGKQKEEYLKAAPSAPPAGKSTY